MAAAPKKRGVTIHLAADAPCSAETDLMQLTEEQLAPLLMEPSAFALGAQTKVLVRDAGGFTLIHAWFKSDFPLPRHSHNTDCMYYVISGSAIMGKRVLRAGDSFFVPANAPYQYDAGPEGVEVLEIRHHAHHTDMSVLDAPERMRQTMSDAIDKHGEKWSAATVSPTFAANAGNGTFGHDNRAVAASTVGLSTMKGEGQ